MHITLPNYQEIAQKYTGLPKKAQNSTTHLLIIDPQLCFTHPQGSLFVAGRSGSGAHDDMLRLQQWLYDHIDDLDHITVSLDDHATLQVFHAGFWQNPQGEHPVPYTIIQRSDLEQGTWSVHPQVAKQYRMPLEEVQQRIMHYLQHLESEQKFSLCIWPYHALRGTISSAIDPILEEALFAHSVRHQRDYEIVRKGIFPFSEQYAAFQTEDHLDTHIEQLAQIFQADRIIITGEARSHCLAWTISSMIRYARTNNLDISKLAVLTDTTSDVVTPEYDYTEESHALYTDFAKQGVQMITTKNPL